MLRRKGVQYVLEALEGLEHDHEVHIVGEGTYLGALREQAARRGLAVTFWGWLENTSPRLKELYETGAIYVFPSEIENFPIVLLEAMAAGMAIVTTNGTGCAEVVGEHAVLVPPRDPRAIRAALGALLHDPERASMLGRAARRRLEERFGWPAIAERYAAVYDCYRREERDRQGHGPGARAVGEPADVVQV
jgi:glycosyltransferase involved in cell wall biosynthesis